MSVVSIVLNYGFLLPLLDMVVLIVMILDTLDDIHVLTLTIMVDGKEEKDRQQNEQGEDESDLSNVSNDIKRIIQANVLTAGGAHLVSFAFGWRTDDWTAGLETRISLVIAIMLKSFDAPWADHFRTRTVDTDPDLVACSASRVGCLGWRSRDNRLCNKHQHILLSRSSLSKEKKNVTEKFR